MALNIQDARASLVGLSEQVKKTHSEERFLAYFNDLDDFIESVEHLLKHNSIKQVPSLLKPKKGN